MCQFSRVSIECSNLLNVLAMQEAPQEMLIRAFAPQVPFKSSKYANLHELLPMAWPHSGMVQLTH